MKKISNETTGADYIDPLHVLIVDDEPIMRNLLKAVLGNMRVSADVAENGVEAQQRILSGSYHLVITDINMPKMDGIALLRWLNKSNPDIEVMVMTGYTLTDEMKKSIDDSEMAYFVKKPLEPVKIQAAVKHCRERIRLRDRN